MQFLFLFCTSFFLLVVADSWPQVFDDSDARRDWNWKPKYDLDKLAELMVEDIRGNYMKNGEGTKSPATSKWQNK